MTALLWFFVGGAIGFLLAALLNAAADNELDEATNAALKELYRLRIERDALAHELNKHDPEAPI